MSDEEDEEEDALFILFYLFINISYSNNTSGGILSISSK
jgi:hypothetical protein